MGRTPCCTKVGLHRGPWSAREDRLLINYIQVHGEGNWRNMPKKAGLLRCGKSCRLRWMNYLRPDIKRGNIGSDEEDLIIRLHSLLGNRWSLIAKRLPGRTDNEIKNYWNSHLSKKLGETTVTKTRVPKKSSQSINGSKHIKNTTKNSANGETSETKIYLPKAIRVSPYSITIMNNNNNKKVSGSSSGHGEETIRAENRAFWPNNDEQTPPCNEEYNLFNSFDISFLDFVPIEDNMLDEVFLDYQQLLKFEDIPSNT